MKMIAKINDWINLKRRQRCQKHGHQYDWVEIVLFAIKQHAVNKDACKPHLFTYERCGEHISLKVSAIE